jgi:hypothetical protein
VGDEKSDPELMQFLEAVKRQEKGQFFKVNTVKYGTMETIPMYSTGMYSIVRDLVETSTSWRLLGSRRRVNSFR